MTAAGIAKAQFRQILGIRFFVGNEEEAIARIRGGGLLVVPAAPALKNLANDPDYRQALQDADLVITDSSFMVMIWNRLRRDSIRRVSGLKYLCSLLKQSDFYQPGGSFWIMASDESAQCNCAWLRRQGIELAPQDRYIAPFYGRNIQDLELLQRINQRRPQHIVVCIGGGTQERLGLYLRKELNGRPSIHCIGAAIAFLSGDQVQIPKWADKLYLGWLFRCLSDPFRYMPRYWGARKLYSLMVQYGSSLPDHLMHAAPTVADLAGTDCIPHAPTPVR